MPGHLFIEKQKRHWHIHSREKPHSQYRIDLKDSICPYCGVDLNAEREQAGGAE
jgi:hypothetical protein